MSKYSFDTVAQVQVDEKDVLRVSLKDSKGLPVDMKDGSRHFFLSYDQVKASIKSQGIDVGLLDNFDFIQSLKTATLDCTLRFKKEGEDFVATENTGLVLVGKKFVKAKAGETYQVAETGIVIDYDEDYNIEQAMPTLVALRKEARANALMQAQMEALQKQTVEA